MKSYFFPSLNFLELCHFCIVTTETFDFGIKVQMTGTSAITPVILTQSTSEGFKKNNLESFTSHNPKRIWQKISNSKYIGVSHGNEEKIKQERTSLCAIFMKQNFLSAIKIVNNSHNIVQNASLPVSSLVLHLQS